MFIKNKYKLYNNYIIYTSAKFQDKWPIMKISYGQIFDVKYFFRDLVSEINIVNKSLLKSLYKFAEKTDCMYLCNLIYECNKNMFKNPFLDDCKDIFFVKSSVFTPPNNFLEEYWTKYHIPFKNLDEIQQ